MDFACTHCGTPLPYGAPVTVIAAAYVAEWDEIVECDCPNQETLCQKCAAAATNAADLLNALLAFKYGSRCIRQHNLCSTATHDECRQTLSRVIAWWNGVALPAIEKAEGV